MNYLKEGLHSPFSLETNFFTAHHQHKYSFLLHNDRVLLWFYFKESNLYKYCMKWRLLFYIHLSQISRLTLNAFHSVLLAFTCFRLVKLLINRFIWLTCPSTLFLNYGVRQNWTLLDETKVECCNIKGWRYL